MPIKTCALIVALACSWPMVLDAQDAAGTTTEWQPDVLLAADRFWSHRIELWPDYDGPVSATLVRRPRYRSKACAVLYLHGYVDYFFQSHLATFYEQVPVRGQTERGCDFFALDLRKYGRSLPIDYPYPNFTKAFEEYFSEITEALSLIDREGYAFVLLNAHSTGALPAVLYLQSGPRAGQVNAMFLNSPFLDFNDAHVKGFGVWVARVFGRLAPHRAGTTRVSRWYARSLHRPSPICADCKGEWVFDTRLKDLDGFPVFLGWVRAVARAQSRARKGGIDQPILVLHSHRSLRGDGDWSPAYGRADLVLDVKDIAREAPKLGDCVVVKPIEDGVHDLVLSKEPVRRRVFEEVSEWLATLPCPAR